MKCKSCGSELAENAKFCTNCGAPVEVEKEPEKTEEPKLERVDAEIVGNANDDAAKASEGSTDFSGNPTAAPFIQQAAAAGSQAGSSMAMSIISMVCGILSILCCCCSWFGVICAIAAIVLGILAIRKECDGKGMAIAGIVCGGIGALIGIAAITIGLISSKAAGLSGLLNGNLDSIEDIIEGFGM